MVDCLTIKSGRFNSIDIIAEYHRNTLCFINSAPVETNLYYLGSRYYDAEVGRFISADSTAYLEPETIGGLNLYAYCLGNPVWALLKTSRLGKLNSYSVASQSKIENLENNFVENGLLNSVLGEGSFRDGLWFGNGSATALYGEAQLRLHWKNKSDNFDIGVFGKFSLINLYGQVGFGDDSYNIALKGVADIGTINGFAGLRINPSASTIFLGLEAKASVLSARVGVQLTLNEIPVEVGYSVDVLSAGLTFMIGIENGEFKFKAGGGVLFSSTFYVRIKLW